MRIGKLYNFINKIQKKVHREKPIQRLRGKLIGKVYRAVNPPRELLNITCMELRFHFYSSPTINPLYGEYAFYLIM